MPILEARHVSMIYRTGTAGAVQALHDISLAIPQGAFVVLTGPSGSGKTTLLSLLGCLDRPMSGHILFAERDVSQYSDVELSRLRRRIGFMFQDFALIPGLPIWENLTYPLIPRGVTRPERWRLAQDWLTRFGLAEKLRSWPRELSGGEQQRVALARACIGNPELLLADEPTSNLDDESGQHVISLLLEFHRDGKTVIVSSHDPRIADIATMTFSLPKRRQH